MHYFALTTSAPDSWTVDGGEILLTFGIAFVVFMAIDLLWLGIVAQKYYQKQIGKLMKKRVDWPAAILFYLLFLMGLLYFATLPALRSDALNTALLSGAAYGFFTYATYDLTNLATLKGWPRQVVVVDIIWGTILAASVSSLTYLLASNFV